MNNERPASSEHVQHLPLCNAISVYSIHLDNMQLPVSFYPPRDKQLVALSIPSRCCVDPQFAICIW